MYISLRIYLFIYINQFLYRHSPLISSQGHLPSHPNEEKQALEKKGYQAAKERVLCSPVCQGRPPLHQEPWLTNQELAGTYKMGNPRDTYTSGPHICMY